MTQIFEEDGRVIPVTVVEAGPLKVVQIKTMEKDGYNSIQIGYVDIKEKKINKPLKGHFDKAQVEYKKYLREFRVDNPEKYEIGQEIKVDVFESGDRVDVVGISKGKGTQGPVKRHGHGRGPETHGSKYHRAVGAMAAASYPGRVLKGKKMGGRMGQDTVTIKDKEIRDIKENYILISGPVPGPKGQVVSIFTE